MAVILLFSLGNASDAFLLLRLTDVGIARVLDSAPLVCLHVVKAARRSSAAICPIGSDAGRDRARLADLRRRLRGFGRHRFGAAADRRSS